MYIVVILIIIVSSIFGQSEFFEPDSIDICFPEIDISSKGFRSQSLCLNQFNPSNDSCTDISISFAGTGVFINFHCDQEHQWKHTGTSYDEKKGVFVPVRVVITNNLDGKLQNASIKQDSAVVETITFNQQFTNDHKMQPDTIPLLNLIINQNTYFCNPRAKVITDRKFKYPAGYMRRGQLLNHPELSMFHYGGGVTMPTSGSVRDRGQMIFEYHILHPGEITYEDLEEVAKKEAWRNKILKRKPPKPAKKRKKPGILKFKPL